MFPNTIKGTVTQFTQERKVSKMWVLDQSDCKAMRGGPVSCSINVASNNGDVFVDLPISATKIYEAGDSVNLKYNASTLLWVSR